ncbi:tryptophan transporter [Clostridium fallax]|uniref:Tryptophan transporter TrpP n=1 Tax=Clostridium fallax TaxID=1533 RepID=A0A1M4YFH6_9CLOT|nr:tryptophan transporter [Clostridium fallax]SHF04537.1 Tryptophan transporter TrpP [Clostridium fallax]SQB22325.1 transporter protein [Clostridium fallax]
MNTKKMLLTSLFLSIGLLINQIMPPLFLGIKPDTTLIFLFIILIINKDYKSAFLAGIISGIFAALTTTFPLGQIPNIIDKFLTANIMFLFIYILKNKINKFTCFLLTTTLGTLISGSIFLISGMFLAGFNIPFFITFFSIIVPSSIANTILGILLYRVLKLSLKKSNIII